MKQTRRAFVGLAASAIVAEAAASPVVDTHIHLFDPTRPGGVPWPAKTDTVLYKPALPDRYRRIAAPFGITGAIEVECSPLVEDNQWVLDIAAKHPMILGMVGNLEPGASDFKKHLDRFHKNPLFLGIRYGNLWGRDLGAGLAKPEFVAGLKALAEAGLVMDSANPTPALLADLLRLSDRIPSLRIVIDHLPQMTPSRESEVTIHDLGKRSQVAIKISEVLRRVDGRVSVDFNFYQPRLDELFGVFGEDRVLYGSDWPNSDQWAEYPQVFGLVREYFNGKGAAVAEKYFWKNSLAIYRWKQRA